VIVSHKYRFIFLRTEKTGGTSLTRALWPVLGEADMRLGSQRPWWAPYSPIHHGALKRHLPEVFGPHAHATAAQMRRVLGRRIFDGYFKFAVERNPWDRQISLYNHRCWKTGRSPDFDADMRSAWYRNTEYCRLNNWSIYAIGNTVVADRVLRYETLAHDIARLLDDLGIEETVRMPHLRQYRPSRSHYSTYYSRRTRDLVARWYAREIDAFGYAFEEASPAGTGALESGRARRAAV